MSNLPESEMTAHDGEAVGGQPFHDLDVLAKEKDRDFDGLFIPKAEGLALEDLVAAKDAEIAELRRLLVRRTEVADEVERGKVAAEMLAQQSKTIATLTAERAQYKEANQTMHDAFMEVRAKLNAWDTPHAPSTEAIVACVSRHLHELVAERDQLIEDIKERDRTYLAVQRAEGLERDRLAAEVARQRRINDGWAEEHAKRMAEMARQNRFWGALEETAARLEAHQHVMCSECEGIRLFVASALDAEAWE